MCYDKKYILLKCHGAQPHELIPLVQLRREFLRTMVKFILLLMEVFVISGKDLGILHVGVFQI